MRQHLDGAFKTTNPQRDSFFMIYFGISAGSKFEIGKISFAVDIQK